MSEQNTENNIETTQPEEVLEEVVVQAEAVVAPVLVSSSERRPSRGRGGRPGMHNKVRRERIKPEFDQRVIQMRRVARVSAGGRRFNFSVAVVIGDHKGKVGVGTGKAGDTALALEKAYKNAKKNIVRIPTTSTMSIPHVVTAKYSSARVMIMPSPKRGIVAGSALRDCIDLAGLNDVNGKIISPSKNKLNIAQATVKALSSFKKKVSSLHLKPEIHTEENKERTHTKRFFARK
jgi:small subunit ribosomal protein S5